MNVFGEMRYFLIFYLNLGFIVRCALVLLILSNFSFLSVLHSFCRIFILFFGTNALLSSYKLHMQSIQNNNREWLHIKSRKTGNAIFEKKLHKVRMKVLEKLCFIDRKLKLDKFKTTSTQHTMKPKFR